MASLVLSSCTSSVRISSSPSQADVYAGCLYIGQTPIRHKDAKTSGSLLDVRLVCCTRRRPLKSEGRTSERQSPRGQSIHHVHLLGLDLGASEVSELRDEIPEAAAPPCERTKCGEVQTNEAAGSDIFVVALETPRANV